MKKIALASAIALASITAAHAAPTVYGKVLLTGEYTDVDDKTAANKDTSTTKLVSNSSRIGFKGEDDLTDTTINWNMMLMLIQMVKVNFTHVILLLA